MNTVAAVTEIPHRAVDDDGKLHIFISHKLKDKKLAETIKKKLGVLGGVQLEMFLSENIAFGYNWDDEVHAALERSDWLFLLYTDPSAEWDWCLYETGYFSAGIKAGKHAPICLHSPGIVPPNPIVRWKTVPADEHNVVNLLGQLYGEPPREGVPAIRHDLVEDYRDTLTSTAAEIVDAFGTKPEQFWWTNFFRLTLGGNQITKLREDGCIDDKAEVTSDISSLKLFNLNTDRCEWFDIKQQLDEESLGWIDALGCIMQDACLQRVPRYPISRFHPPGDKQQLYRPVVYRLDKMSDQSICFKILLIKATGQCKPEVRGNLGSICDLLQMAQDFRWGVIDEHSFKIRRLMMNPATDEEVSKYLNKVKMSIKKVELKAIDCGFKVIENIEELFDEQDDKDVIREASNRWAEVRGELMTAISDNNPKQVTVALDEIRRVNKQFLCVFAKRHLELLAKLD